MRSPLTARLAALLAAVAVVVLPVAAPVPAHADSYVPIGGDGSSWSQNAMSQWQADVAANKNMTVNYPGNGSSAGRQAYAAGGVDFAVSEIPFGVKDNGSADVPPAGRPLKYLPIVAGGTAFMYHLDSGGRRITNLRLDDTTIVKIFTGNLRFWDDKEIKDENPGIALPHREIVPVVRSDGSGTTAQLTTWFDTQPNLRGTWAAYCQANGRVLEGGRCGTTSFFPVSGNKFLALNGSIGVSGYVASDPGEGAITYVEYSYAQNKKFPVAKVLNKSGYYIAPSALNVAVALTSVTIDKDTLLQHLEGVYNSPDRRAYPLSSYSYMIVPTTTASPFSTAKGRTLGDFIQYFLCQGQQNVDLLGYSPLPYNLVNAGLDVVKSIPGANVTTTAASCNNPTVSADGGNKLAEIAPQPQACDKQGPSQCAADGKTAVPGGSSGGSSGGASGGAVGGTSSGGSSSGGASGSSGGKSTTGGSSGGSRGGTTGGSSGGTSSGGTSGGTGGTSGGAVGATTGGAATGGDTGGAVGGSGADPDTGADNGSSGGSNGGPGTQPVADPLVLGSGISGGFQTVLMVLAVLLLLLMIAVPPMMSRRLARVAAAPAPAPAPGVAASPAPDPEKDSDSDPDADRSTS